MPGPLPPLAPRSPLSALPPDARTRAREQAVLTTGALAAMSATAAAGTLPLSQEAMPLANAASPLPAPPMGMVGPDMLGGSPLPGGALGPGAGAVPGMGGGMGLPTPPSPMPVPAMAAGGEVGVREHVKPGPPLTREEKIPGVIDAGTLFRLAAPMLMGEQAREMSGAPEEGRGVAYRNGPPPAPTRQGAQPPRAFLDWLAGPAADDDHPVARELVQAYQAAPESAPDLWDAVRAMAQDGEELPEAVAKMVGGKRAVKRQERK